VFDGGEQKGARTTSPANGSQYVQEEKA
jgi:hypothetical protein